MSEHEPLAELLPTSEEDANDGGGVAKPVAWPEVIERLTLAASVESPTAYWLATVGPDGRPHVVPVLVVCLDGAVYFCSGAATRKGRNLADNPACVLAVNSLALPSLDLSIEGDASKVVDDHRLQHVAEVYKLKYGWQVSVRDGAFHDTYGAPTAGPPPYEVYELVPRIAFGLPGIAASDEGADVPPFSPTRWRF